MDLFKKCYDFTTVDEYKAMGIYPYFHSLETKQDIEVMMEGKKADYDRLEQLSRLDWR